MALLWGIVLRVIQALLQGAPFILTGLCIAAVLDKLLGRVHTRRLFGSNSLSSLVQSWLIGMILPGCSLGVIPVCRQLRASGIAVGTIFAFALSSPLFDPLSILYGLTLSKPLSIMAFAACSLVVVMLSGGLFDKLFPGTELPVVEPPAPPPGAKRMLAIAVAMAREAVSGTALLVGIGLLGVGILAVLLPPGTLQNVLGHDNRAAPLLMTAVALPAYATPMTVMGQLGSMFQHGNSIGAAFVLLSFGAGMNLGLVAWMWLTYGWRKLAVWLVLMVAVVLAISYGIERPLYPADAEDAGHTHAFDRFCGPYGTGAVPAGGFAADVLHRIRMETLPHEWIGAGLLGVLMLAGAALRRCDPAGRVDAWLLRAPEKDRGVGRYDIVLPAPVLALACLGGIVAASVVGCYAYYPPPEVALEELSAANVEAVTSAISGDTKRAADWIPVCEGWNRRLVVGAYLRHGRVSDYHRAKSRLYQDRLEELEHAVEDGDPAAEVSRHALDASRAFRYLGAAFRSEPLD
ncbi:MAG: permease [Planctomycetes bacterium]|nr:permease [Planctomycetota bacterium]